MAESDAERAATDAKNEFVARVSHELRTPINTILGFGELLCLADLTAEHHDWVVTMVRAARQLGSVLDDLLDLSRAETSKLSLSREPVDVASVLTDAVEIIRPLSASHGVYIDPLPPVSAHVLADQQRLRQVLLNLLSNAVKYNHPAGRVTIAAAEAPGGRLRISIADTGRGIAE